MLQGELEQQGIRQEELRQKGLWQGESRLQEGLAGEAGWQGMQERDLRQAATGADNMVQVQPAGTGTQGDFLDGLPQVDGLDWRYAWLYLPDAELLEYTVKEFYAQLDSAADRLELAYGQIADPEQLGQYRIQVHAMKSLAATVGLMSLSGVAKILEFAARDGKIDVIMAMTNVFLEEWRSYRQKLQGVFGIGNEVKKEVADYSVMQALVEMVRQSMQEMDIDEADRLVGELQAYEYPEEMGQDIRKLAEAVTNLDPEETDRLAGVLIGRMAG